MRKTTAGIVLVACASLLGYACIAPKPPPKATQPKPPAAGSGDFLATFDAKTDLSRFRTQTIQTFSPPDIGSWLGDHDAHCGAPTTYRTVRAAVRAESVYWCAPNGPASGHIMTSMNTTAFGQVNFSPNKAFTKIKRVCWDQNLTDLGSRKWTNVVVVPEATYQANKQRLDYLLPGFQAGVNPGAPVTGQTFLLQLLRGRATTFLGQTVSDSSSVVFSTTDKAQRFRHCITDLENGTVKVEMSRPSGTEVRTLRGAFPNGAARVIFQDDSYDPPKDAPAGVPNPFTWHWDNILVDV
jgi:hypothetical protein